MVHGIRIDLRFKKSMIFTLTYSLLLLPLNCTLPTTTGNMACGIIEALLTSLGLNEILPRCSYPLQVTQSSLYHLQYKLLTYHTESFSAHL